MNFGEAKARFRRMIGNPSLSQLTDAQAGTYVNEAQRQISLEYQFREVRCIKAFNTIAGTHRYILPSDLSYIRRVWDFTNKREIVGPYGDKSLAQFPTRFDGRPLRYIREQNWIELDPAPNAVMIIKFAYIKLIADHANDADALILPLDWHLMIPMTARWLYYNDLQDYPKSQSAWNTIELWTSKHPLPIEKEMDAKDLQAVFVELDSSHYRDQDYDFDRGYT